MKILYLVPKDLYDIKMSRVRFDQYEYLAKHPQIRAHMSGPGWDDWNSNLSTLDNVDRIGVKNEGEPDIVIAYKVGDLKGAKYKTVTQFNEADDYCKVDEYIRENCFNVVVFHHENDMAKYLHWDHLKVERFHIPHCANTEVFRDWGLEKEIDILVYGAMSPRIYPFRLRLAELARKHFSKRGYKIEILGYPGYNLPQAKGTCIRGDLSIKINRSKVVFGCSSIYKYALGRYSEVACSKSLMVADTPEERIEFFEDTILQVEPWMLDSEITRKVEDVLDEPVLLDKLTKASYEKNMTNCTMEQYAGMFYDKLQGYLDR